VTNQVDAEVNAVKTTGFKPPLDLAPSHAGLYQLPARHDPELPRGNGRNNPIRETRDGSTTDTVANPAEVWFAPITALERGRLTQRPGLRQYVSTMSYSVVR
jgi:hypothetical protein